jgi:hypothetical protein
MKSQNDLHIINNWMMIYVQFQYQQKCPPPPPSLQGTDNKPVMNSHIHYILSEVCLCLSIISVYCTLHCFSIIYILYLYDWFYICVHGFMEDTINWLIDFIRHCIQLVYPVLYVFMYFACKDCIYSSFLVSFLIPTIKHILSTNVILF